MECEDVIRILDPESLQFGERISVCWSFTPSALTSTKTQVARQERESDTDGETQRFLLLFPKDLEGPSKTSI